MANNNKTGWLTENFYFPKIFQSFRIAVHPKNLVIAFVFLVCIWSVGRLLDLKPTVAVNRDGLTELDVYMMNISDVAGFIEQHRQEGPAKGVFETIWKFGQEQLDATVICFIQMDLTGLFFIGQNCVRAIYWVFFYHPVYAIFFGLFQLAALAIAGGSICRISALQFAKGEKPGFFEAIGFSTKKFSSFFSAPLVPLGIIFLLGFFIAIAGLLGNIPYVGVIILGILMRGMIASLYSYGMVFLILLRRGLITPAGQGCINFLSRLIVLLL